MPPKKRRYEPKPTLIGHGETVKITLEKKYRDQDAGLRLIKTHGRIHVQEVGGMMFQKFKDTRLLIQKSNGSQMPAVGVPVRPRDQLVMVNGKHVTQYKGLKEINGYIEQALLVNLSFVSIDSDESSESTDSEYDSDDWSDGEEEEDSKQYASEYSIDTGGLSEVPEGVNEDATTSDEDLFVSEGEIVYEDNNSSSREDLEDSKRLDSEYSYGDTETEEDPSSHNPQQRYHSPEQSPRRSVPPPSGNYQASPRQVAPPSGVDSAHRRTTHSMPLSGSSYTESYYPSEGPSQQDQYPSEGQYPSESHHNPSDYDLESGMKHGDDDDDDTRRAQICILIVCIIGLTIMNIIFLTKLGDDD